MGRFIARTPGLGGLLVLIAAVAGCSNPFREGRLPRNADLSVGYVGRDACLPCHASIGQKYSRTGMGRSFYPLTADTAVEDFTLHNRLDLPSEGLAYEMTSRDGAYWMRQMVLDKDGSVLASVERKMIYVVGSGNHSRSYLTGEKGFLSQMPVCWYPDKPGWDLCPGYEYRNLYFTREADGSCLFCHNARVPLVEGTTHRYGEPMPHGIDCERCHGPGGLHVAFWKHSPATVPEHDDTIVNPARLPRATRIHVCLQCHLGDADASERVIRSGINPFDFRPGESFTDYVDVMTFDHPEPDRFGLGGQGDRLMMSRCYKESGGAIDCLTCHDPHVPVRDQAAEPGHFRKACLTCHDTSACALPEARRRETSPDDDCVSCHMRRSQPADQKFTIFTDHWIRRKIDPPGAPPPRQKPLSMAPFFPERRSRYRPGEDLLDRGRALLSAKTGNVAGARIPWSEPENLLTQAVAANPKLAEGSELLGNLAFGRGRITEAIGHYRQALMMDSSHRGARVQLAAALLGMGRAGEVETLLKAELAGHPEDVEALSDLGRAEVMLGRDAEGENLFRRATDLTNVLATPLANLGLLHLKENRAEEAVVELEEAAAREPQRTAIWKALASALKAAGRAGAAAGAERRVVRLEASAKSGSRLRPADGADKLPPP